MYIRWWGPSESDPKWIHSTVLTQRWLQCSMACGSQLAKPKIFRQNTAKYEPDGAAGVPIGRYINSFETHSTRLARTTNMATTAELRRISTSAVSKSIPRDQYQTAHSPSWNTNPAVKSSPLVQLPTWTAFDCIWHIRRTRNSLDASQLKVSSFITRQHKIHQEEHTM